MAHLINKDALVAEIERKRNVCKKVVLDLRTEENKDYYQGKAEAYKEALDLLDTLEVKEVDLEKEVELWMQGKPSVKFEWGNVADAMRDCAKHFFELGLKVSNPITAADRGTAEEIIINLKRVEEDYYIDLTREIEWLRNKVKKGKSYNIRRY